MKTCKTCNWWKFPNPWNDDTPPGWGACLRVPSGGQEGRSLCTLAFIDDNTDYLTAVLVTHPDFGCACWEQHRDLKAQP